MSAPTLAGLADPGLLSALAIAYDHAGMRDRAARLAHAAAHVGRPLTTSAELTTAEARELRRHVPRCSAGCPAAAPAPTRTTTCACTDGGHPGQPSTCDPAGVGRYCPPAICWCGHCPWWAPAPPVGYAAAIAKLADPTGGPR